jgi:hypothetical protein
VIQLQWMVTQEEYILERVHNSSMEVKKEDEFTHTPEDDVLWWENYHFNGYDPVTKIGFTTYTAVKPAAGVREEIIVVYPGRWIFKSQHALEKNALKSGSLKMEPVELLKKWNIFIHDTFEKGNSNVKDVTLDITFESDIPPHGYSTNRGDRYEQPGSLHGEITIGDASIPFSGKGIRDHSWEFRHIPSWGEWYGLMGYFGDGFLTSAYMDAKGKKMCQGWVRTDTYSNIVDMDIDCEFTKDILERCSMVIKTDTDKLELMSQLISYVHVPLGGEQKGATVIESLVQLNENGYGFLWYGNAG